MRNEKELDGLKMEGEAKMTDNKPANVCKDEINRISALLDALQYYVAHHMNAPEGEITLKDNLYAQDIKSKLLEAAIIALTTKPTEDTK